MLGITSTLKGQNVELLCCNYRAMNLIDSSVLVVCQRKLIRLQVNSRNEYILNLKTMIEHINLLLRSLIRNHKEKKGDIKQVDLA